MRLRQSCDSRSGCRVTATWRRPIELLLGIHKHQETTSQRRGKTGTVNFRRWAVDPILSGPGRHRSARHISTGGLIDGRQPQQEMIVRDEHLTACGRG